MSSPVPHKIIMTAVLFNVMKSSDLLWYFIYLLWIFCKLPTRYGYKVSQFLYEITFESKYAVEGKG